MDAWDLVLGKVLICHCLKLKEAENKSFAISPLTMKLYNSVNLNIWHRWTFDLLNESSRIFAVSFHFLCFILAFRKLNFFQILAESLKKISAFEIHSISFLSEIRTIIIIIIIIWFGDTVTVSHSTKCNTYSKVRALS